MKLINYIRAKRIPEDKELTREECVVVLRAAGFRKDREYSFKYSSFDAYYDIDVYDDRVKVRMCNGGLSDSESIMFPVTKEKLKKFVNKSIY